MKNDEEVVMYNAPEAAKFVTNISGWVSRHGQYWGSDEHMARWSGCTHKLCDCGKPMTKSYTACNECRAKNDVERYNAMPFKEWSDEPLYSRSADEYFFNAEDIYDYCENNECTPDSLQLVICEPRYAREIDPNEYYCDDLPEDGEVDGELEAAFKELNEKIKAYDTPLSWHPSKVRTSVPPDEFAITPEPSDSTVSEAPGQMNKSGSTAK
jgi:hypothetical protein